MAWSPVTQRPSRGSTRRCAHYVLQGSLVRVKVWTADGRIVYSDESRLIGRTFALGEDELEALRDGSTDSEISDLDEPENEYERPFEKLLEVYVGMRTTTGRPLLFEAYFRYDAVAQAGQDAVAQVRATSPGRAGGPAAGADPVRVVVGAATPATAAGPGALLPAGRDASGAERRRIAADLHDGVVQELDRCSRTPSTRPGSGRPTRTATPR